MKVKITIQNILQIAAPIAFALLIPQISFLANSIFLGSYGEKELGINGVAGVFYLTASMIGYGLSNGSQIKMARKAGEGRNTELARVFINGCFLSLFLSLSLMLLSLWTGPIIMSSSLNDSSNVVLSVNFIFVRIWGLPFLMLTQHVNAFFIATSKSKYLIIGSAFAAITNIVLDYLLIFGNAGFPEMGIQGAALASVVAEITYFIVMFSIFVIQKEYLDYPVKNYLYFDFPLAKKIINVSLPLIIQYLFSIGGWLLFFIFIEHMGNRALASSQILRSLLGVLGITSLALASTCNTMVSNIIGQNKQDEVIRLVKKIAKISLIASLGIGAIVMLYGNFFIGLYRNDPVLIEFTKPSLYMLIIGTWMMSLGTVVFNGVLGTGKTRANLAIEISCVLIYILYCFVVIEYLKLPLTWAWGSEVVYWSALLIIASIYLKSKRWKVVRQEW